MSVLVLVDGRSGSGKTQFAAALHAAWPGSRLLRLDDVYPGWAGLDRAAAAVGRLARDPSWREWDWAADRPGRRRRLPARGPLIVEGVGAITPHSRRMATLGIWVELEEAERRRRVLERDGTSWIDRWEDWARLESRHERRDAPRRLADLVIRGREVEANVPRVLARITRRR